MLMKLRDDGSRVLGFGMKEISTNDYRNGNTALNTLEPL